MTETLASDFNLPVEAGALGQAVTPKGQADDAGLRAGDTETTEGLVAGGDIIIEVDGEQIEDSADIAAAIADDEPGETIEIDLYRGDERRTVDVVLDERPERIPSDQLPGGGGGGPPFPIP